MTDINYRSQVLIRYVTLFQLISKVFSFVASCILFKKGINVARCLESHDLTDNLMFYEDDYLGKVDSNRTSDLELKKQSTLGKLTETKEIYVKVRM